MKIHYCVFSRVKVWNFHNQIKKYPGRQTSTPTTMLEAPRPTFSYLVICQASWTERAAGGPAVSHLRSSASDHRSGHSSPGRRWPRSVVGTVRSRTPTPPGPPCSRHSSGRELPSPLRRSGYLPHYSTSLISQLFTIRVL